MLKRRITSGTTSSLCYLEFEDSIFIGSYLHGHVERDADGYGGMGFNIRNAEREIM